MKTKHDEYNLTIQIYAALGFVILTLLVLLVAWYVIDVLLLTFAGVLLAIFLRTLNNFLSKKGHLSDSVSMTLVLGGLITAIVLVIELIAPTISNQMEILFNEIPVAWIKLKQALSSSLNLKSIASIYEEINLHQFLPQAKNVLAQTVNFFSTTFGLVGSILVFLFIGISLAYDPNTYTQGFLKFIPLNKREKAKATLDSLATTLSWWLFGKILSMVIVGVLTSIGLWMLGVPLALTLGLLAAILTFIPNLGPILSAIPAILIAIVQSPTIALYVIILYVVIQTLESYILTPVIQKKIDFIASCFNCYFATGYGSINGYSRSSFSDSFIGSSKCDN
ncbi:MAG: AI-2E family transporter [Parachlamydiaceae bacterium]|nr:AI-2E family transporter [Parachlamydiaceae bacterium]